MKRLLLSSLPVLALMFATSEAVARSIEAPIATNSALTQLASTAVPTPQAQSVDPTIAQTNSTVPDVCRHAVPADEPADSWRVREAIHNCRFGI